MKEIGLFEAKTKFSEICEKVAGQGEAVLVTRRGIPLVRIEPLKPSGSKKSSVWKRREAFVKKHGSGEDFDLPAKETQIWRNPLA